MSYLLRVQCSLLVLLQQFANYSIQYYIYHSFDMTTYDIREQVTPLLLTARSHLNCTIRWAEDHFNSFTSQVDFPAFCFIYFIILIWILRKVNRRGIFRPKNKELVSWKSQLKKKITTFFISLPFIKQYVQKKFNKGMQEVEITFTKELDSMKDPHRSHKLPTEGMKKQNLESRIHKWIKEGNETLFSGKLSGTMYAGERDVCQKASDFAAKYMYHNPLHLDAFKELAKMEAQVLMMTASLISKEKIYGMITSGGSESLIMSMYAYKNYYKKERPNIVVPNTIHAAVDKGAKYFNIELRKARLNEFFEVDVSHMQSLIDSNTIALYGSYPNYPHGIIDPIHDIAKLAVKHKVGFHIDGCLGGLVAGFLEEHKANFSMDIEGVTSVSLDHHKYGLAPKGVSTIFYKTRELRHHMYFVYSDWIGGLYGTPSFVGSRPGFASAGAWYVMTHIGRKQYIENAKQLSDTTKTVAAQLKKIEGVVVLGNPQLCVLAFDTTEVGIYSVCHYLKQKKGWHMSSLHLPRSAHICITPANVANVRANLAKDVKEAINHLKKNPEKKESDSAALYGATATFPKADMGDELLRVLMKVMFS